MYNSQRKGRGQVSKLKGPGGADTLSARVEETLKEAIFSGTLRPGQPLRELRLARSLRVSQATVREALARMEQYGLVVRVPNKGSSVTNLSAREIRQRLRIRCALEELAAREASSHLTEDDLEELVRLVADIQEASASGSEFDRMRADLAFHRLIWQKSGNEILHGMLERLVTPLFAFLIVVEERIYEPEEERRSHEAIISALAGRDPDQICRVIRQHTLDCYRRYLGTEGEFEQPAPMLAS